MTSKQQGFRMKNRNNVPYKIVTFQDSKENVKEFDGLCKLYRQDRAPILRTLVALFRHDKALQQRVIEAVNSDV